MPKRMPMGFPNAPVNQNFGQGQVTTTGAGSTPQIQNIQSMANTGKMCGLFDRCFEFFCSNMKFYSLSIYQVSTSLKISL